MCKGEEMVGGTRIELVTPCVSSKFWRPNDCLRQSFWTVLYRLITQKKQ
jgi:hypothetical protein